MDKKYNFPKNDLVPEPCYKLSCVSKKFSDSKQRELASLGHALSGCSPLTLIRESVICTCALFRCCLEMDWLFRDEEQAFIVGSGWICSRGGSSVVLHLGMIVRSANCKITDQSKSLS